MKGICHRCWREGELLYWWPISRSCFRKLSDGELIASKFDDLDSFRYTTYPRYIQHLRYPLEEVILKRITLREGCTPQVVVNFLPIHQHYHPAWSLGWAERRVSELDLAINVMTLAYSPTDVKNKRRVKLAGGSVVSEDIWNLHHFFRSEFIEKIPYEGGSIDLVEVREWMDKYSKSYKRQFLVASNFYIKQL